jgi:hypothetical protein
MNEEMVTEFGATLVDRINSLPMSQVERQVALDAMRSARLLVDGCVWVTRKLGQLGNLGILKPSVQR